VAGEKERLMSGSSVFDWDKAENEASRLLLPDLADLLSLATDTDELVEQSINAVAVSSKAGLSLSAQVQTRLLVRMAHDLRAVVLGLPRSPPVGDNDCLDDSRAFDDYRVHRKG
jgi:hypothetical protein